MKGPLMFFICHDDRHVIFRKHMYSTCTKSSRPGTFASWLEQLMSIYRLPLLADFWRDGNHRGFTQALSITAIIPNLIHSNAFTECHAALKNRHALWRMFSSPALKACDDFFVLDFILAICLTEYIMCPLMAMAHDELPHKEIL